MDRCVQDRASEHLGAEGGGGNRCTEGDRARRCSLSLGSADSEAREEQVQTASRCLMPAPPPGLPEGPPTLQKRLPVYAAQSRRTPTCLTPLRLPRDI